MSPTPELAERIRWFIRLRWLAVAGILIAAGVVASLELPISWQRLFGLAGLLAALNAVYAALSRRKIPPLPFTWWQITADLTVLTLALHVSGGIENPFAFFYVFHVIIASILLPPRVSYLVAALATLFFLGMAALEHSAGSAASVRRHPRHLGPARPALAFALQLVVPRVDDLEGCGGGRGHAPFNAPPDGSWRRSASSRPASPRAQHALRDPGYAGVGGSRGAGGRSCSTGVIRRRPSVQGDHQSLLNFARKSEIRIWRSTSAALREAIDYLRFKKRTTQLAIETDLADVPNVQADPGQLLQVFLSILVNSADAIVGGGTITVRSRAPKDVVVTIVDTGCGIPDENLKKVFEPFFTTKEPGEGTGLGLSLSYGIVKQLGGTIDLKSKVGEGTEVTIALPR
jgi:hypothetical protein